MYTRIGYLYQAATLFTTPGDPATSSPATNPANNAAEVTPVATPLVTAKTNLARFYVSTLRTVAAKSVLRLDRSVKRTLCKRCDAVLVPGMTAEHRVENNSRGGRKPWADVLVVECKGCRAVKRFPVGMDTYMRRKGKEVVRAEDAKEGKAAEEAETAEEDTSTKATAKAEGTVKEEGEILPVAPEALPPRHEWKEGKDTVMEDA